MPELDGLLAALRSEGHCGDAVFVSVEDCGRALERYIGDGEAVGIVGPYLCLTRRQLLRMLQLVTTRTDGPEAR